MREYREENMIDSINTTIAEGFCDGCGRRCPLSAPHCPTGMKKAGMEVTESSFEGRKNDEHRAEGYRHEERGRGKHGREGFGHDEHGPTRHGRGGHKHGGRRFDEEEGSLDWFEGASEEDLLFHSIRRCGNHLKHGGEKRSSQQELLSFLSNAGGSAIQSELGSVLDVRRASISELLTKMEAHGLIERRQDENDKRQLIVSLTEQGRRTINERMKHHRAGTSALFSVLTAEEKKQLQTLLDKLLTSWSE